MKEVRIQKLLAECGIASRRQIETMIKDERLTVNGELATLGVKAKLTDNICLDGRRLKLPKKIDSTTRIIAYYKPDGEISTRDDPEGRPTIFDKLPSIKTRWINVGRLDINSSGLLLFTNNGELAKRLMHPSYEIEREYAVRVLGEVDDQMLARLKKGVELEDGPARFKQIKSAGGDGSNSWYHVVICEGRTREVRRLWESQGLQVSRLLRMRYGNYSLPRRLRRGQLLELSAKEIKSIEKSVGL